MKYLLTPADRLLPLTFCLFLPLSITRVSIPFTPLIKCVRVNTHTHKMSRHLRVIWQQLLK